MSKFTIKDIDHGWKNIKKNLKLINFKTIEAGVLANEGRRLVANSKMNVATLASIHEFGATIKHPGGRFSITNNSGEQKFIHIKKGNIHIPERSFIRYVFSEGQERIFSKAGFYYNTILEGSKPAKTLLKEFGYDIQELIKTRIATGKYKPLSRLQVWKKGHGQPLIESGTLYNSIKFRIVKR